MSGSQVFLEVVDPLGLEVTVFTLEVGAPPHTRSSGASGDFSCIYSLGGRHHIGTLAHLRDKNICSENIEIQSK